MLHYGVASLGWTPDLEWGIRIVTCIVAYSEITVAISWTISVSRQCVLILYALILQQQKVPVNKTKRTVAHDEEITAQEGQQVNDETTEDDHRLDDFKSHDETLSQITTSLQILEQNLTLTNTFIMQIAQKQDQMMQMIDQLIHITSSIVQIHT